MLHSVHDVLSALLSGLIQLCFDYEHIYNSQQALPDASLPCAFPYTACEGACLILNRAERPAMLACKQQINACFACRDMAPGLALLLVHSAREPAWRFARCQAADALWGGRAAAERGWLHSERPLGQRPGCQSGAHQESAHSIGPHHPVPGHRYCS